MKLRGLLCALALLVMPALASAGVQASLDRSSVQLGETVTLNLHVQDPHQAGAPDLGPLAPDFTILGMSSNNSISIVNGRRSDELTYGIALRPKRIGHLVIPSLAVAGSRTAPLSLEVTAPVPQAMASGSKDVFLEAEAEPTVVYVGQQLVLTVRLYYAAALSSGSLADPQLAGMDIRRLGDDINYDTERGGRSFHVIERRYALVPQHAGRIEIPSLDFQGEMVDPTDPDSFFGMGTPVSAASPVVPLEVQPPPAEWGDSAWLPARQVQLTLTGLPSDGKLRVGQPLDLTMTLEAQGLPYEALPALSLPALEGATVYPDKPATRTGASGPWIVGRRQQDFAVVPNRAGTLVLPATTVKWWNVQTGRAEFATVPAHRLSVLPAAGAAAATPAAPRGVAARAKAPTAVAHRVPRLEVLAPWWRPLGGAALVLLMGAIGWLVWSRRRANPKAGSSVAPEQVPVGTPTAAAARVAAEDAAAPTKLPSARARRAAFMAAAREGTTADQVHGLLAWAKAERNGISNLGELAAALDSAPQRSAIAELQRRRYSGRVSDAALALDRVFATGLAWAARPTSEDDASLPPLYPFKLH
jgi:hypothetical protein